MAVIASNEVFKKHSGNP